ncbi:MAG: sulfotransferase family protein [Chloroflexota bacterium]
MRVIGVGLGRTGTTSIQRALEHLGYHTYNFEAVMQHQHFDAWRDIVQEQTPDWDAIFGGYDASISWPACFFYQELHIAYPDAQFILTTREPERWAASVKRVLPHMAKLQAFRFIPRVQAMVNLMNAMLIPKFGSFDPDTSRLISLIEEHNRAVRSYIPSPKLLIYEVKDGWEPLCAFLDCPIPSTDFPYENQGDGFVKQMLERFTRSDASNR